MRQNKLLISLVGAALVANTWAVTPKINLDFDNTEVTVVLRHIATLWGKSLKIDPTLSGKVSIHLREVEPEQAVRLVLAKLGVATSFRVGEMSVNRLAAPGISARESARRQSHRRLAGPISRREIHSPPYPERLLRAG
jgi:type II secretory pathway component HofQ